MYFALPEMDAKFFIMRPEHLEQLPSRFSSASILDCFAGCLGSSNMDEKER
jgi:hypothetical protein